MQEQQHVHTIQVNSQHNKFIANSAQQQARPYRTLVRLKKKKKKVLIKFIVLDNYWSLTMRDSDGMNTKHKNVL